MAIEMKLKSPSSSPVESVETDMYGSMTLSRDDREALLKLVREEEPTIHELKGISQSEAEDLSREYDPDLGPGPANVYQFKGGASYPSAPMTLDASHSIDQPSVEGRTSATNNATAPLNEDSLARVTIIGKIGVSTRALAA